MTEPDLRTQIVGELYRALERLDADEELLAIVGSWRDTLDDDEVLEAVLRFVGAGREHHPPPAPRPIEPAPTSDV